MHGSPSAKSSAVLHEGTLGTVMAGCPVMATWQLQWSADTNLLKSCQLTLAMSWS